MWETSTLTWVRSFNIYLSSNIYHLSFIISVDWKTESWILSGFSEVEESLETICSSRPPGRILQPNTAFFYSGLHTCNIFNSDMGLCDSRETALIMKEYFDRSEGERCRADPSDLSKYYYWCGYTDERTEAIWLDVNTDKPMARPDLLWWKAQPNGREHQNCMEATYYSSLNNTPTQWNDNYCNTSKEQDSFNSFAFAKV